MARQTKAEIQAEFDELLTTLKPRLEELVDIVHTMDTSGADTHNLHEEAVANIRLLIADLVDLPAWGGPVPGRGDRAEHLRRLLPGPGPGGGRVVTIVHEFHGGGVVEVRGRGRIHQQHCPRGPVGHHPQVHCQGMGGRR